MNKIKNALYGAASAAMALAPAIAGAQWDVNDEAAGANLPSGGIYGIINQTMNWLLGILGFIGIIGFVISGILYLTAAGDEGQIDKAKNAMMYSIIGVIVALMGFVIIQAVNTWLGGDSAGF